MALTLISFIRVIESSIKSSYVLAEIVLTSIPGIQNAAVSRKRRNKLT